MSPRQSSHLNFFASPLLLVTALSMIGCGNKGTTSLTTSSGGNVTVQTNPLAGVNAAALDRSPFLIASQLIQRVFFIHSAQAAVSAFTEFKLCVSEVVYELLSGQSGASSTPLKPGLVTFSPSSTTAMTIGNLDISAGAVLKNIKFTIATVPSLCGGVNYSVRFNHDGLGAAKEITQDVSFRFDFGASGFTPSTSSPITLFLGGIVTGMVAKGSNLDGSTIQTVNVGQAL